MVKHPSPDSCPESVDSLLEKFGPPPFSLFPLFLPLPFPVLLSSPCGGADPCTPLWMKRLLFSSWHLVRLWIHIYWFAFGRKKKRKGRGEEKEKHTVTHSLTSWLPRGHVQSMTENFNCVPFLLPKPSSLSIAPAAALAPPSPGLLALLQGIQHRENVSVLAPPPFMCWNTADTDPLYAAADPKKFSCRVESKEG